MKKLFYVLVADFKFLILKYFFNRRIKFTLFNLISPTVQFEIEKGAIVELKKNISIRRNSSVIVRKNGYLTIGENVFLNNNCLIACHGETIIGNNCKFGPSTMLFDHDHNMQNIETVVEKNNFTKDSIVIGDGCWFGAGCIILKGTTIGSHCVFAAGSIIKGDYKERSVVIQKRIDTIRNW